MAISLRSVKTFLGPGAPWKEPSRVFVESNQARTTQSEVRGVEEGIERASKVVCKKNDASMKHAGTFGTLGY